MYESPNKGDNFEELDDTLKPLPPSTPTRPGPPPNDPGTLKSPMTWSSHKPQPKEESQGQNTEHDILEAVASGQRQPSSMATSVNRDSLARMLVPMAMPSSFSKEAEHASQEEKEVTSEDDHKETRPLWMTSMEPLKMKSVMWNCPSCSVSMVMGETCPQCGKPKPESNLAYLENQSSNLPSLSVKQKEEEQDPEAEAEIHFKPVVKLTEKYEARSGEEEEDVLFAQRAKLYRFVDSQWKERGTGELKILQNKENGKVRILMRRDQVLKICCNHYLTADMKLTEMADSDKAWTWFSACDFSEGSAKAEKFAAKFKTVEIAQKFKETFEQYQQIDIAKDRPSVVQSSSSLVHLKPVEGSWECSGCYSINNPDQSKCPSCQTTQPGKETETTDLSSNWECDACGVINTVESLKCLHCPSVRIDKVDEVSEHSQNDDRLQSPEEESLLQVLHKTLRSSGQKVSPKSPSKPSSENTTPIRPKPTPTQSAAAPTLNMDVMITRIDEATPELVKKARSFKLPDHFYLYQQKPPCPGCRGCFDDLTMQDASTDTSAAIPHRRATPKEDELVSRNTGNVGITQFSGAFRFSNHGDSVSALNFNWMKSSGGPKLLFTSEISKDVEEEEQDPEAEAEIHFKPVVKLTEKYEARSGEEEEEVLFAQRAKLYRFVDSQWKERGTGELKILQNKENGKVRILMRRDQVLKICCNHYLTADMKLTEMADSDKAWTWFSACDFSEGSAKAEKFAARFKTVEIAQKFKETFQYSIMYTHGPPDLEAGSEVGSSVKAMPELVESSSVAQEEDIDRPNTPPEVLDSESISVSQYPGTYSSTDIHVAPVTSLLKPKPSIPIPTVGQWKCNECENWNEADSKDVWCKTCKKPFEKDKAVWRGSGLVPGLSKPSNVEKSTLPLKGWSAISTPANPFYDFSSVSTGDSKQTPEVGRSHESFLKLSSQTAVTPLPTETSAKAAVFGSSQLASLPKLESTGEKGFEGLDWMKSLDTKGFSSTPKPLFSSLSSQKEEEEQDPEAEAEIHFKPVVKLTEKYEARSGEEEEDVLFAQRAKLYRFVDSQWKERGTGELKILQNRENGKVRILMRRDQVLKICCNHYLTADMKLTEMADSDKAWTWFSACDFSEGSAKAEKFAARFKTVEIAQKFKETFEQYQQIDIAKDRPSVVQSSSSLVHLKPVEGSWECSGCYSINNPDQSKCPSCQTTQPGKETETTAKKDDPQIQSGGFKLPFSIASLPQSIPASGSVAESKEVKGGFKLATSLEAISLEGPLGFHIKGSSDEVQDLAEISSTTRPEVTPTKPFIEATPPSATHDVIITHETLATPEQVKKAKSLFLPEHFYLYETKPNCPGCRGCTDDLYGKDQPSLRDKRQKEFKKASSSIAAAETIQQEPEKTVQEAMINSSFAKHAGITFASLTQGFNPNFDWMKSPDTKGFSSTPKPLFSSLSSQKEEEEQDPEAEAEIHFKPVVKLTEKYEARSGEEEEDVLFAQRAKLYRFVDSQWKERGTGELKILQNRENGKVRILMRRDQVLKICCNHYLTADMKLTEMADSDKAWTWFSACDFSEGSAKAEKFAARFKTVEIAQKFKETFEQYQQIDIAKDRPSVAQSSSSLVHLKPVEGSWECSGCYSINNPDQSKCPSCQTTQPGKDTVTSEMVSQSGNVAPSVDLASGFKVDLDLNIFQQNLPVGNALTSLKTEQKQSLLKKGLHGDSILGKRPLFKVDSFPSKEQCDGDTTSTGSSEEVPSPSTTNLPAESSSNRQPSEVGMPEVASGTEQTAIFKSSIFGSSQLASLPKLESTGGKGFEGLDWMKSLDTKGFSSTPKPLFSSLSSQKEEEQQDPEAEAEIHFKPVVKLTEKYEARSGEEEEEVLFAQRAKLYRFVDSQWKERGTGELKILQNKENGKVRILMRRDQVLKICCNHYLTADMKLTEMANSDKSWSWFSLSDFTETQSRPETFAVRFKTQQIAKTFYQVFEECTASINQPILGRISLSEPNLSEEDHRVEGSLTSISMPSSSPQLSLALEELSTKATSLTEDTLSISQDAKQMKQDEDKFYQQEPTSEISEQEPTSETAEQEPTSEISEQEPTSETTEQEPTSETAEQEPTSETAEQEPTSEISEQEPTSETAEQEPTSEISEQEPTSETTEQEPTSETAEQEPTSETAEQEPTSEISEQEPTSETAEQEPTSEISEQEPTSEISEQEPTSETAEQEPTSEIAEQEPTSEISEQEPTSEISEQEPTSETAEQEPTSEISEQEPTSETTEQEPTSETAEQEPTSETAEQEPTSEISEQEPTSEISEQEPTSEISEQEPTSETTEQETTSEITKQEPTSETTEQETTSEISEQEPTSETAEQEPTSEISEQEPTSETAEQEPTSETTEQEPTSETTEQEPTSETTEQEPTSETTEQEPTSEITEQEPTSEISEQEPTSEISEQEPTSEISEQEPTSEITEQEPTSETAEQEPTSENTEQEPTSEITEQEPTSEITEQEPTSEISEQETTSEISEQEPTLEITEQEPTSETAEQEPTSEITEQEPTSEISEQEPTSETAEQEPTSEISEQEPTSETTEQEPTSETAEQEPTSETAEQEPTSEISEQEPTSETAEQEPTSEISEQEPTSETTEQETTSEISEQEPTSEISEQEPTSETTEQEPTSETTEQEPTSETAEQEPTSETAEQEPTSETTEQEPTSETTEQEPTSKTTEQEPTSETAEQEPTSEISEQGPIVEFSDVHDTVEEPLKSVVSKFSHNI